MSDIRANTISDAAGTGPIDLYKQSAAKAWFDHTQTSINLSFNLSSISDEATGLVRGNYTSQMASAHNPLYSSNMNTRSGDPQNYSSGFASTSTSTFYYMEREASTGVAHDMYRMGGGVGGDLA